MPALIVDLTSHQGTVVGFHLNIEFDSPFNGLDVIKVWIWVACIDLGGDRGYRGLKNANWPVFNIIRRKCIDPRDTLPLIIF